VGWPDLIGVVNASSHGVCGIIIGELSECLPTVFRLQWPPDITANVISEANPKGTITNSDLELTGLVLLWLMMEHVCGPLTEKRIALKKQQQPHSKLGAANGMSLKPSCQATNPPPRSTIQCFT